MSKTIEITCREEILQILDSTQKVIDYVSEKVFCPTGEGGGVDSSCSPDSGGGFGSSGKSNSPLSSVNGGSGLSDQKKKNLKWISQDIKAGIKSGSELGWLYEEAEQDGLSQGEFHQYLDILESEGLIEFETFQGSGYEMPSDGPYLVREDGIVSNVRLTDKGKKAKDFSSYIDEVKVASDEVKETAKKELVDLVDSGSSNLSISDAYDKISEKQPDLSIYDFQDIVRDAVNSGQVQWQPHTGAFHRVENPHFGIVAGQEIKYYLDKPSKSTVAKGKAFCPTGEGGGVDNTCSPEESSGSSSDSGKISESRIEEIKSDPDKIVDDFSKAAEKVDTPKNKEEAQSKTKSILSEVGSAVKDFASNLSSEVLESGKTLANKLMEYAKKAVTEETKRIFGSFQTATAYTALTSLVTVNGAMAGAILGGGALSGGAVAAAGFFLYQAGNKVLRDFLSEKRMIIEPENV